MLYIFLYMLFYIEVQYIMTISGRNKESTHLLCFHLFLSLSIFRFPFWGCLFLLRFSMYQHLSLCKSMSHSSTILIYANINRERCIHYIYIYICRHICFGYIVEWGPVRLKIRTSIRAFGEGDHHTRHGFYAILLYLIIHMCLMCTIIIRGRLIHTSW